MSHTPTFLVLGPMLLITAGPAAAAPAHPPLVISNVHVVDVEQSRLLPQQSLLIEAGRITRLESQPPAAPSGAIEINATGLYLIPGLIDSHVHYIDPQTYGRLFIAHGVTLVRDMAGFTEHILGLRDALNRGEALGPEMIATGAILDGDPPVWPFSEVCQTAEEGRAAVRKLAGRGVNQIKVYSRLQREPYEAIVAEAHAAGLKAVGHVPEAVGLEAALKIGQDCNEHLTGFSWSLSRLAGNEVAPEKRNFIDATRAWTLYPQVAPERLREFLGEVKAAGMVQCPTLVVMQGLARLDQPEAEQDPRMKYVSASMKAFWHGGSYGNPAPHVRAALPHMKALVAELHRAGVPLICGTDLANPYVFAGASLHEEMALLQEAGIPPAEVLKSATITPATFFGVSERLGSIAPGKSASLVLLRANPLEDVRNAAQIAGVVLQGRYFDRLALDKLMEEARSIASPAPDDAKPGVALELPGKPLLRGRYTHTFQGMDSGAEDFVITQTESGYHLKVHQQPKGFGLPAMITVHTDPEFKFVSASFEQLTATPTRATYTRQGNAVVAQARTGDQPLPEQTMPLPDGAVFGGPVYASSFLTRPPADLQAGQTREITSIGFGYPSWQMTSSSVRLTRHEDTTVEGPQGTQAVRHYTYETQTPMGVIKMQTWVDEHHLTLKARIDMPFGAVDAVLQRVESF